MTRQVNRTFRNDLVDGCVTTKTVKGKQYTYFQSYDTKTGKLKAIYCGPLNKGGDIKARTLQKEYIKQHIKDLELLLNMAKNRLAELETLTESDN
jgi:hypothetical protein